MEKKQFLESIKSHIDNSGFHITLVSAATTPRWAYTIGLKEKYNMELVFAGGIFYMARDVNSILHQVVGEIVKRDGNYFESIDLEDLGVFSIRHVDHSWARRLMLGVYDYYKIEKVNAFQIVPDEDHFTLDVPDMTKSFDTTMEPVWQWFEKDWDLDIPEKSTVTTNIEVLMGTPITEIVRWEDDYWEMFSEVGPDGPNEWKRVVSIGTIIAIDPSVTPALNLPLEKGFLRDSKDDDWRDWG
ncbi:DUF4262 domain-containing protein [Chitinophaga sp. CF418]|uniref:DUF4262 domain-containing protein n=1 Tax=Chitinophaga sp. CF418 TaxID=1855287 RepID=UPI0009106676|nr:DUF4262 domain-containing protein [Chitinophaga sp. CF418]SHN34370.1 protein of unknown function [Chitinophaga sp. CF418]